MATVPYTTTYTDADREYLGNRMAKSPAICQVLELGRLMNDTRQLAAALDADGNTLNTYTELTIDEPSAL